MQIAIDGPSGSGKSTVARILAERLKFTYLDTGAMYRAVALFALENHIDPETDDIENYLNEIKLDFRNNQIFLNDRNVSDEIRSKPVTDIVSKISANRKVRERMSSMQQALAAGSSIIMDGRDIGSVVLPDADYKFFITASPETRAYRRALQEGKQDKIDQIKRDLIKRDNKDSTREISPLVRVNDAILIENDALTIEQTIDEILKYIQYDL